MKNQIATPSVQEILDLEAQDLLPPGSEVLRDAGGVARRVSRARLNRPSASITGVDLSVDWDLYNALPVPVQIYSWWSFLDSYRVRTTSRSSVNDLVGGPDAPRWKSRSGIAMDFEPVTLDVTANGVASFGNSSNRAEEWWSFDARSTWTMAWDSEIVLGVRNLTDKRSRTLNTRNHEYLGRGWFGPYRHRF